jgi:hypothetical protein
LTKKGNFLDFWFTFMLVVKQEKQKPILFSWLVTFFFWKCVDFYETIAIKRCAYPYEFTNTKIYSRFKEEKWQFFFVYCK